MENKKGKNTENKTVENQETGTTAENQSQNPVEEKQRICMYSDDTDGYSEDEYRECCDMEPDEEINYSSYWAWVNDSVCAYWEDFVHGCFKNMPDNAVLVTGYSGLWDGTHEIVPVIVRGDDKECALVKAIGMCQVSGQSGTEVWLEPDGTVSINVAHHDGTNHKTVRLLTPRGLEIAEDIEEYGEESEYKPEQIEFELFTTEHFWGKE